MSRIDDQEHGPIHAVGPAVGLGSEETHTKGSVPSKLTLNKPDDKYDEEAERIADSMMRMPESDEVTPERIQRSGDNGGAPAPDLEQVTSVADDSGQPLSKSVRSFFEPRFSRDFGDVRVHTGPESDEAARSINAEAFTTGRDIFFRKGNYQPESIQGKKLLAHELTHVLQQRSGRIGSSGTALLRKKTDKSGSAKSSGTSETQGRSLPANWVDKTVREVIESELEAYRNIPVTVGDTMVTVAATYFINEKPLESALKRARSASNFEKIRSALSEEVSLIKTAVGSEVGPGLQVELGKATPEDLKRFIQQAIEDGRVETWAKSTGKLGKGKSLTTLKQSRLQNVIQEWVHDAGVGVDCSGLVVDALVKAQTALRTGAKSINKVMDTFGVERRYEVPSKTSRKTRPASGFTSEPQVPTPSDLRPGDVWVVRGQEHIRIVQQTKPVEEGHVKFWTAESTTAGKVTGPAEKVWQTTSVKDSKKVKVDPFKDVENVKVRGLEGAKGSTKGSFHRVL